MRPLWRQLKDRRTLLRCMMKILEDVVGEDIPRDILDDLNIDFNYLDMETGATHPTVTPYFLPRNSIPPCREIMAVNQDYIWRHIHKSSKQSRLPFTDGRTFQSLLYSAIQSYTSENLRMDKNGKLTSARGDDDLHRTGWKDNLLYAVFSHSNSNIEGTDHLTLAFSLHWEPSSLDLDPLSHYRIVYSYEGKDVCHDDSRPYEPEPHGQPPPCAAPCSSHELGMCRVRAHTEAPSVSEVQGLLWFILKGVEFQIEEVKKKEAEKKPLDHFHRILPRITISTDKKMSVRVLYAYFDDERLRVQYTHPLSFRQLITKPQPGVTLMGSIDWSEHWRMMDILIRWSKPVIQGDDEEED